MLGWELQTHLTWLTAGLQEATLTCFLLWDIPNGPSLFKKLGV